MKLLLGCGGVVLLAVIIATVSMVIEVRRAARKRGIQGINASVHAWAEDDREKERTKEANRPRYPGNACQLCGSTKHSTHYHMGR